MLLTMILSYYCISNYLLPEDLLHFKFIYLVLATLLTAAAGYIINDYYDVKLDLVNKPQKVIVGNIISRRWAMLLHTSSNIAAFVLGFLVNSRVAMAIIVCSILLFFYSVYFKRKFLTGNLIISFLSGFMIVLLWLFNKSLPETIIFSYAVFAFISTLIREIIKDTEDLKGDSKFDCRTLPIVLGVRKTKAVLQSIILGFVILLLAFCFYVYSSIVFHYPYIRITFIAYIILFIFIPALFLSYRLYYADVKKDFSRLSLITKIIMIAGILSMVFLKF